MAGGLPTWTRPLTETLARVLPPSWWITLQHLRAHNQVPNLERPATFSEKIQWRKIYDRDPRMPPLIDKFAAKRIVEERLGSDAITPTYWYGGMNTIADIRDIKDPFVLKPTHTSGDILFITQPDRVDWPLVYKTAQRWVRKSYDTRAGEWAYKSVEPGIMAEAFLNASGSSPTDYKFFCFNGKVKYIQVDSSRFSDHRRLLLDGKWEDTGITYKYPRPDRPHQFEVPSAAQNMIDAAEALSQDFSFCRVDLYDMEVHPRFGEITFYPEGGLARFWVANDFDAAIFKKWSGCASVLSSRDLDILIGTPWKI